MNIHQKKKELRAELRDRRRSISEDEFKSWSAEIRKKVVHQPEFTRARTVHCYVSMNRRREVNTRELIKEMFSLGKEVVVPVTNFEDGTLTHVLLSSFDDLEENRWGVMEPRNGENISIDELDLVMVPMVGADERGNRIGYGKGFYDRFLEQVDCPKFGLVFERNMLEEIPVEEFDVPMDKIITEKRILRFK